jgi:PAS domain S-box-containing protein
VIRASELKYRRLFESAKDGILILDVESGRITDVNPFLLELLDFAREDVIGKTIWELETFKDLEAHTTMLERVQKTGAARYEGLPLQTHTGRKIAVEFVSHVYQVGDRHVIQCTVRDITDRKRADDEVRALNAELQRRVTDAESLQAQFIQAQKMEVVGQLAGGVAHDFNNILGVIIGYSDLVEAALPSDSAARKDTAEIRLAAERAVGLTRQLLVFSRKETVQIVVLDINETLGRLDTMLHRLVDENIALTIVPGAAAGCIKADSGHVGQVLMNLVVNARDAMPTGGALTIAVRNVTVDATSPPGDSNPAPGEYVMLSVTDTGTGLSAHVKAHLFEAFFTTKPAGTGTGLGLSTCLTIVQQLGGHISVDSEIGRGTVFKVHFPRVDEAAHANVRPPPGLRSANGTETILIVEDEPALRSLARSVLLGCGYHVLSASNGQDALRVAKEHHGASIRLVITDVIMPLMGGKIMAEWLTSADPNLKVLFTSGYHDEAMARNDVLPSDVAFLPKPYTPAELSGRVREMLDAPLRS